MLAKYSVGKAFDPYRDETGKIGTEGHARLAMAARAREQGIRREDMDLEPFLRAQQELELNRPTYQELREKFFSKTKSKRRRHRKVIIMAKIVQALTRASKEYDPTMLSSLVRDLDSVLNKLNTSFQQELKQEVDAQAFFIE